MEELEERREQLELMMQWRESLRDLAQDTVNRLSEYWQGFALGACRRIANLLRESRN